jgi:cell wall-associated NlpC family hydrolase
MTTGYATRTPRARRRGAAWGAAGVVGLAAGAGLVATAGGADAQRPQLRAWSIESRAPALPLPDEDVSPLVAATPDDDADDDARSDAGEQPTPAPAEPAPDTLPSGAPTDEQVEAELRRALRSSGEQSGDARSLVSAATVTADGMATIPPDAPAKVAEIIRAGNRVARKPYVYGGGHGRLAGEIWNDSAYDCSGSISFTLAAAGMIDSPMTSGALASWGRRGPGKWVTIYANDGHTFMYVAGLRFDTSGRAQTGSRWQSAPRNTAGFTVVHPPGL